MSMGGYAQPPQDLQASCSPALNSAQPLGWADFKVLLDDPNNWDGASRQFSLFLTMLKSPEILRRPYVNAVDYQILRRLLTHARPAFLLKAQAVFESLGESIDIKPYHFALSAVMPQPGAERVVLADKYYTDAKLTFQEATYLADLLNIKTHVGCLTAPAKIFFLMAFQKNKSQQQLVSLTLNFFKGMRARFGDVFNYVKKEASSDGTVLFCSLDEDCKYFFAITKRAEFFWGQRLKRNGGAVPRDFDPNDWRKNTIFLSPAVVGAW